jgi:PIN domain nuclease of toxin-antitoxin system
VRAVCEIAVDPLVGSLAADPVERAEFGYGEAITHIIGDELGFLGHGRGLPPRHGALLGAHSHHAVTHVSGLNCAPCVRTVPSWLGGHARALIEDEAHDKQLSTAGLWEKAIKLSLGRLTLVEPFGVLIPQQLRVNGIEILNIDLNYLAALTTLLCRHPGLFDRLTITQAIVEQ